VPLDTPAAEEMPRPRKAKAAENIEPIVKS
jgi:hypothetical protein